MWASPPTYLRFRFFDTLKAHLSIGQMKATLAALCLLGQRRGESIKLWCRPRLAGDEQQSTGLLHLDCSIPFLGSTKRKTRLTAGFSFGGAEGNRTPVRKQLGKNFSGRSLLFTFPQAGGNKHPTVISSFIMHGTRKALRAHVLHSNHTRARLVDLPGRMRA